MSTIEFKNRKPSKAQVMRAIGLKLEQGANLLEIYWGENSITLELIGDSWHGWGWLKDISGDDIAQELNAIREQAIKEIQQFKKDHFQFVHIGG